MSATRLVTLSDVGVSFGDAVALDGVDLEMHEGEVVTLIGPNGAGKSTLLKVVLGLQAPTRGRVIRRPGLRFGYVPQRFSIDPTMPLTVERFLDLPVRRARAEREVALAEVGAAGLARRPMHGLSGGEFQRVLLAGALLRRPGLMVLDEPLQGVDVRGQAELHRLIMELKESHGFGLLMVSHDLHLVMRGTHEVLCLNGHVCCHGAPEAVSRHPSYRALFGPEAAEAFAVYRHHHDHAHAPDGLVVPAGEDR